MKTKETKKELDNSKIKIRLTFAALIAGVIVLGILLAILSHYQYI